MLKPSERQQSLLDKKLVKMSNEKYHAESFFMGSSMLKNLDTSVEDFVWQNDNPMKQTPAMLTGSATHTLILEGREKFDNEYILSPKFDKRTTKGKKDFADFQKKSAGKIIITPEQNYVAEMCNKSILKHSEAKQLFQNGSAEISGFFEFDGIYCKVRPDYLLNSVIVDLKTTSSGISQADFSRTCAQYKYDIQTGLYQKGMNILTGQQHDFIFIVVQSVPPFNVAIFEPDNDFLMKGATKVESLIDKYKNCVETDTWTEQKSIQQLSLPGWY